jgi:hypothetical protein
MVSPSQSQAVRDYDPRDPPRFGEWVRVQGMTFPVVETDDAPTQPNGAPMPSEYLEPPVSQPLPDFQPQSFEENSGGALPNAPTEQPAIAPAEVSPSQIIEPRQNVAHRRARAQRLTAGVLLAGVLLLGVIAYRGRRHEPAQEPPQPVQISLKPNFTASFPEGNWQFQKPQNSIPDVIKAESWLLVPASPAKFSEKFTVEYFALKKRSFNNSTLRDFLAKKFITQKQAKSDLQLVPSPATKLKIFELKSAPGNQPSTQNRVRFIVREKPRLEVWKLVATAPRASSIRRALKSFSKISRQPPRRLGVLQVSCHDRNSSRQLRVRREDRQRRDGRGVSWSSSRVAP